MKVRVCVRTRPTQNFAQDNLSIDTEHGTIRVKHMEPETNPSAGPNNRQNAFSFKFDYVFHNATQAAVYDLYARDCVHGVSSGINGSILSYGQTGSGKTFTMIGDANSYEHRGVAPRAINQLFAEIGSRVETEYMVSCTFMEIYNERIYDLLGDLNTPDYANEYTIAEDTGRGVFVRGLAEIEVKDENSALNLLFSGGLARTVASHKLNKRSNRSHSIFTLYVQQKQKSGVSEKITHSKLHLIDLAGSERLKKTMDSMDGMGDEVSRKESMAINQSLTFLEQCVVALGRKGSHVPFRQSKLTNIMKDCLGANCNTVMIACIWGESSHLEETVSTLRLASRMMKVTNETTSIETVDTAVLLKKQEKIIVALKQELLMHDALVERTGVRYDPYTPEQSSAVGDVIERYVQASERDEESILDIRSYRQMLEICKQFKRKLLEARSQSIARTEARPSTAEEVSPSKALPTSNASGKLGFSLESNRGFGLGEAKADSRPAVIETGNFQGNFTHSFIPEQRVPSPSTPNRKKRDVGFGSMGIGGMGGEDMGALEEYVKLDTNGAGLFADFSQAKSNLKDLKSRVKALQGVVNESKYTIDQLTSTLESKKQTSAKSKTKGIVDEEEFRIAKQLKETKQTYRNNFEQMQKLQQSSESLQNEISDFRDRLLTGYEKWSKGGGSPARQMEDPDALDDAEAFERLENERVMANDPDSMAFFTAQKTMRANLTQSGTAIRMVQRNRRFG